MIKHSQTIGIEINPKLIGVLLTEKIGDTLRLFCFYTNAEISQVDVPAEENRDNLRAFFTTLNMEETCSSLILDEVVQGRVYLKIENQHWLYTLLKSSRAALPPLNADLADLPWRVIWRSQEAQVLEYGQPGDAEHCYAIRKEIGESDAERLVKNSKAFTKPVSIPRKQPHRWVYANLVIALLAVGILVSATILYTFKQGNHASTQKLAVGPAVPNVSVTVGCFLLYNHQITGPFPVKFIADLNTASLLNPEVLCRLENSNDWIKPADLLSNQPPK